MKQNKAFTIIEILVVIFLFSALILLSSSSLVIGFVSGRLHSSSDKALNRDLSFIMDTVRQKMASANTEYDGAKFVNERAIYGFNIINNEGQEKLAIASNSEPEDQCFLIGLLQTDQAIYAMQDVCGSPGHLSTLAVEPVNEATKWKKLTSNGITITNFSFTPSIITNPLDPQAVIPSFTLTITGTDTRTGATMTLTDTFTVSYEAVERFQ